MPVEDRECGGGEAEGQGLGQVSEHGEREAGVTAVEQRQCRRQSMTPQEERDRERSPDRREDVDEHHHVRDQSRVSAAEGTRGHRVADPRINDPGRVHVVLPVHRVDREEVVELPVVADPGAAIASVKWACVLPDDRARRALLVVLMPDVDELVGVPGQPGNRQQHVERGDNRSNGPG